MCRIMILLTYYIIDGETLLSLFNLLPGLYEWRGENYGMPDELKDRWQFRHPHWQRGDKAVMTKYDKIFEVWKGSEKKYSTICERGN